MGDGARISWGRLILGMALALGIAAALAVLVGPLVATSLVGGGNYRVHDDSMAPALIAGDWVLAEKLHPGEIPERGAIVAYEDETGGFPEQRLMRLIGLPGERIQMRGGALYIDGRRAAMERLGERVIEKRPPGRGAPLPVCLDDPVKVHGDCRQELWRETLPDGTSQLVINGRHRIGKARLSGEAGADDTPVYTVPKDHVFVIGDNRDQALDSRFPRHGTVPVENLRHRVWMVHTSLDRTDRFPQPRLARFFRKVD